MKCIPIESLYVALDSIEKSVVKDEVEDRSLCKLRHKNGNCLCVGGFCTAVNDEICKSIRMAYEKGYVDGKSDGVRHGRWVNLKISTSGNSSAECSLCGAVVHNNFSNVINFCPNCGADMRGADDETD